MYGTKAQSFAQKAVFTVNHLVALAVAFWLMFAGGIETVAALVGFEWTAGDALRRALLLLCSSVYLLRLLVTDFVLLKRKLAWGEAGTLSVFVYVIHLTFALFGGAVPRPVGIVTVIGLLLYLVGSYLNTGSEYMRHLWKQRPEHKGQLYTEGLFKYSMHINYFGDLVLFAGFVLVSGSVYTLSIPALMATGFIFVNIPMLDKYLAEKYGQSFEDYARRTKKLIPFIY